jgi:serine kinase of HPr protein (carbohydrate metabolism regulator)
LDLILRGHRLVADDMVHIQKRSPRPFDRRLRIFIW